MKKIVIICSVALAVLVSAFCFYIIQMNRRIISFAPTNISLALQDVDYSFTVLDVEYSDEKLDAFVEDNFSDFSKKDAVKQSIDEALNSKECVKDIDLSQIASEEEITRLMVNNSIKDKNITISQKQITGLDDIVMSATDLMDFVDERYIVSDEKVNDLADTITSTYEANDRQFVNCNGDIVDVPPCKEAKFGWIVDTKSLKTAIVSAINSDGNVEIPFKQTGNIYANNCGVVNDIGSKYIEISLDDQHLWVKDNGMVIYDCDVVTGKTEGKKPTATPKGVFNVTELKQNETMRGSYGTAFAEYWLRLTNSGIGIHAAAWRGSFGGNIYKYNGSHGCINVSVADSKWLYENIERSTVVVIY